MHSSYISKSRRGVLKCIVPTKQDTRCPCCLLASFAYFGITDIDNCLKIESCERRHILQHIIEITDLLVSSVTIIMEANVSLQTQTSNVCNYKPAWKRIAIYYQPTYMKKYTYRNTFDCIELRNGNCWLSAFCSAFSLFSFQLSMCQ